jgi:hypothetical protein
MSVRSFTGSGNSLPPGGSIVTINSDGITSSLSGLKINNDTGSAGQIVAANGDGTMSWQTSSGGGGGATTLGIAMSNGNEASTDLDMNGFNIVSSDPLSVSGDSLTILAPQGLYVGSKTSAGDDGDVLTSKGAGSDPEWVAPSFPTISEDVQMNGYGLVGVSSLTALGPLVVTGAEIDINGRTVFGSVYPSVDPVVVAAGDPPAPESLTTKQYVQSLIGGAVGVTTGSDNTWTGENLFLGATTVRDPSIGYAQVDTIRPFSEVVQASGTPIIPYHRKHYVCWRSQQENPYVIIPDDVSAYDGCSITFLNASEQDLQVRAENAANVGLIRNFTQYGTLDYPTAATRLTLHPGRTVVLEAINVGDAGGAGLVRWCATSSSDTALSFSQQL